MLPAALAEVVRAFARRTRIEQRARLKGDFGNLTQSQHLTLLNLGNACVSPVGQTETESRPSSTVISVSLPAWTLVKRGGSSRCGIPSATCGPSQLDVAGAAQRVPRLAGTIFGRRRPVRAA
jgi:hypothetical protein